MGDTSSEEVTFDQISELAREMYFAANPTLSALREPALSRWWKAEDEVTRLFWRKEAQRKLQEQRRYKADRISL